MTGYQSKKGMARDKLVQWANEAFNDWWNNDYDDSTNPYEKDTFAYWAWAGWQAALAQPAQQEHVAMRMPKVGDRVVCIEDESLATVQSLTAGGSPDIKFDDGSHGTYLLREFAELFRYASTQQRPWVDLTGNEWFEWWRVSQVANETEAEIDFADFFIIAQAVVAKLKEDNNG